MSVDLLHSVCQSYAHPTHSYSHGFLFPSEVTRVRQSILSSFAKFAQDFLQPGTFSAQKVPTSWSYSSVSAFGVRYSPPVPDLTIIQSVEALVEGSDMSKLREGQSLASTVFAIRCVDADPSQGVP